MFFSEIEDDEERYHLNRTAENYVNALLKFHSKQKLFEEDILLLSTIAWEYRAHYVLKNYDQILRGLVDRPMGAGRMTSRAKGTIDELATFCNALCIGWKLWPDCWTGLEMMLDYFAMKMGTEDILRMSPETISVLNEIGSCTTWRNNPTAGSIVIAAQAKVIIKRYDEKCSFEVENGHSNESNDEKASFRSRVPRHQHKRSINGRDV
jgi:hypothetical protein